MKYKTFRALVLTGVAVAGIGGIVLAARHCGGSSEPQPRPEPEPVATTTPSDPSTSHATTPPPSTSTGELREVDREVLTAVGRAISNGKQKDAFSNRPYKVNLYQDAGHSTPNRVKVDLDRDNQWDEKWSLDDGGTWKRQVAPADDEQYTAEYRLSADHGRWQTKDEAATPTVAEHPAPVDPSSTDALRPVDTSLLELAARPLGSSKKKDAFSGEAYKVNVYQDAGHTTPNRAKLDLDRDGKWDEKWDFGGSPSALTVKRHVAPADDEQYTDEYRLDNGHWVVKK